MTKRRTGNARINIYIYFWYFRTARPRPRATRRRTRDHAIPPSIQSSAPDTRARRSSDRRFWLIIIIIIIWVNHRVSFIIRHLSTRSSGTRAVHEKNIHFSRLTRVARIVFILFFSFLNDNTNIMYIVFYPCKYYILL